MMVDNNLICDVQDNATKNESTESEDKQPATRSSSRRCKQKRVLELSRKVRDKTYSCKECSAVFSRQSLLKEHKNSHSNRKDKKLLCEECKLSFSSLTKLLRHKQIIHSYVLKCKLCGNEFAHVMSYNIHMRVHFGDRPYACNECDAKFTQSAHFSIHKRSHTGEKPYKCEFCQQCFKQISHLRAHERIHTQSKPYVCSKCGSAFIQKSSLKRHYRIHTGERPYICSLCKAAFSALNNLNRHMHIHSNEHPFECYCGATFAEGFDLKRHEMAHEGLKPFSCDKCAASFSRKSNLKWHQLTHTGETPLKCEMCPAEFMKPRDLRKHKISHKSIASNTCSLREKAFTNKEELSQHAAEHSAVKTVCDICSKTFSAASCLRRHRLIHFKNFLQCKVCKTKFKNESALLDHNNLCGKENKVTSLVTHEKEPKSINQMQIIPQIYPQSVEYLQVQGAPAPIVQTAVPYSIATASSVSQPSIVCDTNGYLTVTNQGPAIILGVQNESMVVAKPSMNCPNVGAHIYVAGDNSQMDSWCFCGSTSTTPDGQNLTLETISAPNQTVDSVQLQKYLPVQAFPADLGIRSVGSQPLVLGTLNVTPINTCVPN